ncbi:MAG: GTP cyclohydrolase I FolE [Planctomycetes bacterium]|nr:GTP cyclohydrolase I FolE [Planctomycetota bacterium]
MINKQKIMRAIKLFLEGIGESPDRAGLKETPRRVADLCEEIYAGLHTKPEALIKPLISQEHDEIVLVKDIPFYSICEHHLLPFIGKAHVAYLPEGGRISGISKLARVVDTISKRPQVQERLTVTIAETIMKAMRPKGVMVIIEAEHLCMTMRGIKKPGSKITTSVVRGIFRTNPSTRAETMSLIYNPR